jgi:YD repeat-containing protein
VSDPVEAITYDAASRITGWTLANQSAASGSQSFGYDTLDRLTSNSGSDVDPIRYTYDAAGRPVGYAVPFGTQAYSYDDELRTMPFVRGAYKLCIFCLQLCCCPLSQAIRPVLTFCRP